ncbi:MAG: knotted carbamoyltransferase YgeW [Deltaproteobacteria bacterium]|nr:knotted carbamoyltransferase YgeW [Deltaproteobacteria bacterium]
MGKKRIQSLITSLAKLKTDLYQKDFLLTWLQSDAELKAVLTVADILEQMYRANISTRVFDGGLAVSNFRDKSTRTRFSFASACSLLGLTAQDLDESKSQVAHGETVRETANMISFVTEAIGIRDDLFVGYGHEYMREVSESVELGYQAGVLPQRPAVINLQCDRDHPTQSMADLLHLVKTFGSLKKLRGKKLAMTWAYSPSYGKPLSVPQGIITLMTRFGMDVVLAHPEGYDLMPETLEVAARHAAESGGSFTQVHDLAEAFTGADIVYPKSWAPVSLMEKRTTLLKSGKGHEVEALEKEGLAQNAQHQDWECTEKLMSLTTDGAGLYLHCLPADITDVSCKAGEVAATVFDRYRDPTYHEAEHKLYVIAAMIMLNRFKKPARVLAGLLRKARPRRAG